MCCTIWQAARRSGSWGGSLGQPRKRQVCQCISDTNAGREEIPSHTHTHKSLTQPQAKPLHLLTAEEWRNRRISKVTVSLQHPLQTHLHRPTGLLPSYLALQKCSEALWANVGTTSLPTPTALPRGRRSVSVVFFLQEKCSKLKEDLI